MDASLALGTGFSISLIPEPHHHLSLRESRHLTFGLSEKMCGWIHDRTRPGPESSPRESCKWWSRDERLLCRIFTEGSDGLGIICASSGLADVAAGCNVGPAFDHFAAKVRCVGVRMAAG